MGDSGLWSPRYNLPTAAAMWNYFLSISWLMRLANGSVFGKSLLPVRDRRWKYWWLKQVTGENSHPNFIQYTTHSAVMWYHCVRINMISNVFLIMWIKKQESIIINQRKCTCTKKVIIIEQVRNNWFGHVVARQRKLSQQICGILQLSCYCRYVEGHKALWDTRAVGSTRPYLLLPISFFLAFCWNDRLREMGFPG